MHAKTLHLASVIKDVIATSMVLHSDTKLVHISGRLPQCPWLQNVYPVRNGCPQAEAK